MWTINFQTENFNILTLYKGANSNFFNVGIGDSLVNKFSNKRALLNRVDCIFLYNETESFIKNQAIDLYVTGNHRMWVSRKYSKKNIWLPHDFEKAEDIL